MNGKDIQVKQLFFILLAVNTLSTCLSLSLSLSHTHTHFWTTHCLGLVFLCATVFFEIVPKIDLFRVKIVSEIINSSTA